MTGVVVPLFRHGTPDACPPCPPWCASQHCGLRWETTERAWVGLHSSAPVVVHGGFDGGDVVVRVAHFQAGDGTWEPVGGPAVKVDDHFTDGAWLTTSAQVARLTAALTEATTLLQMAGQW
jgi:hypothetical protein